MHPAAASSNRVTCPVICSLLRVNRLGFNNSKISFSRNLLNNRSQNNSSPTLVECHLLLIIKWTLICLMLYKTAINKMMNHLSITHMTKMCLLSSLTVSHGSSHHLRRRKIPMCGTLLVHRPRERPPLPTNGTSLQLSSLLRIIKSRNLITIMY